jgi:hypothetical protein
MNCAELLCWESQANNQTSPQNMPWALYVPHQWRVQLWGKS